MTNWRREGDGFWFAWPQHGVGLAFSRIRDHADTVHAEIVAHGLQDGAEPNGYLSAPSGLNLLASRSRDSMAAGFAKRNPGPKEAPIPWGELLEVACGRALQEHRRGEPSVDLADVEAPLELPFLLTKLAPQGEISVVYGDGSQGKSLTLLTGALLCRSAATLPGGIRATQQCEVAYFDWETNAVAHRRRLEALTRGFGLTVPRGIHYFRMTRPAVDEATRMQQEIARRGIGLVLWDSLGYAAHGDMKEAHVANELMAVARSLNTTVWCAHHMSKESARQEGADAEMFGSRYFRNGARNAWEMRATQEGTRLRVALFHRKANDDILEREPVGWEYRWDRTTNTTSIHPYDIGADAQLSHHAGAQYVLQQHLAHGELRTIKELVEATGLERETVKKALQRSPLFLQVEPGGKGRGNEGRWGVKLSGS